MAVQAGSITCGTWIRIMPMIRAAQISLAVDAAPVMSM
jgi:hypothetical protein